MDFLADPINLYNRVLNIGSRLHPIDGVMVLARLLPMLVSLDTTMKYACSQYDVLLQLEQQPTLATTFNQYVSARLTQL